MSYAEKKSYTTYKNDYKRLKYDVISFCVPKGKKAVIQRLAAARGLSISGYLVTLIDADLQRSVNGR